MQASTRPVAVLGGNRIPFARSNTVYAGVSNQEMLTATLDGLADRFDRVEIVSEKDVATYRRVIDACEVEPHQFLMIGNSVRSDVLPVVELGGHAVHLPYTYTWELEHVEGANGADHGYHELRSIRELPALVEKLSAGGA